jgi:hypothetical protein
MWLESLSAKYYVSSAQHSSENIKQTMRTVSHNRGMFWDLTQVVSDAESAVFVFWEDQGFPGVCTGVAVLERVLKWSLNNFCELSDMPFSCEIYEFGDSTSDRCSFNASNQIFSYNGKIIICTRNMFI